MKIGKQMFVILPASLILIACLLGCDDESVEMAIEMTGGDPQRGKSAISGYGCAACHTIPGVRGANSKVGPPLTAMSQRMYIAGVLPNTADNMVRWIQDPQHIDPKTAMPNVGVKESDARDIASYLYTLK